LQFKVNFMHDTKPEYALICSHPDADSYDDNDDDDGDENNDDDDNDDRLGVCLTASFNFVALK